MSEFPFTFKNIVRLMSGDIVYTHDNGANTIGKQELGAFLIIRVYALETSVDQYMLYAIQLP